MNYTNLSHLARQPFLMLLSYLLISLYLTQITYLLTVKAVAVIGDCYIEGYQYCVPFNRAFELLLTEGYTAFILTIDTNVVSICLSNEGKFKIFDSH